MANAAFEEGLQRADARRQDREAHDMLQRKFLADQYQNYANNIRLPDPTADPEGYKKALDLKNQALEAMQKAYSPDHHATLAEHLHGLIFGAKQQAPQSSQAPTLPPTAQPNTPASAHPFDHNPVYTGILKGLEGLGSHLKAAAQPNGPQQPLPKLSAFAAVPSDSELVAQDKLASQKEQEAAKIREIQETNKGKLDVAKLKPATSRVYTLSHLTGDDLAKRMELFPDEPILGVEGEPITPEMLEKSPQGTIWQQFRQGGQDFWAPTDATTKTVTVGNEVYQVGQYGSILSGGVPLGQARVGTTSKSVTPGPAGNVVTTRTAAPVTSGIANEPTEQPKGPVSSQAPRAIPKKPLSKQPGAQAQRAEERKADEIPPLRNPALPPMRGADEQRIASVSAPMHTVEQQVIGRGVKPLWEYSAILNNPDMLKTVNLAMAAPMLQTPEGNKGITFWGTVATSLGLASAAQRATSEAITKARDKVQQQGGPEAVEFLDRLAELKGTIPNMRKIQGGSSAMGAIAPLYQESPIMNITSPEDFRNRTANMMRTMAAALEETPGINKKHVDWLYSQADRAQNKPVSSGAPQVPPPRPDTVPQGYIFKNGSKGLGWYAPAAK